MGCVLTGLPLYDRGCQKRKGKAEKGVGRMGVKKKKKVVCCMLFVSAGKLSAYYCIRLLHHKKKVKLTLKQAMKAHRGSRGRAVPFLSRLVHYSTMNESPDGW
jgi:hypothetical protein